MVEYEEALERLRSSVVVVTGGKGSVGVALYELLPDAFYPDIEDLDVRDPIAVEDYLWEHKPDYIFHLAGAKHAPEGEEDPAEAARTNLTGTLNLLAATTTRTKLILASTSKAANPETAYGASKLIAERAALNAGQSVARFYNIIESSGNVFEIWGNLHKTWGGTDAYFLPYTDACRYFITVDDALSLLVMTSGLPSGRYTIDPGNERYMRDVLNELYPEALGILLPLRRGDRKREPRYAEGHETIERVQGRIERIRSRHDK